MKLFAKEGDQFIEVPSRPLVNEAELQRLLQQHSKLIPLDLDARRVVVREFPTSAGPIDHLLLDAAGQVLVVETKLASNADRRRVIAQAIDYAAQLTKYGPQNLLDTVRDRCENDFTEGWFDSQVDRESFLRNLESTLRQGRLTVLIVMDQADDLLRDSVRFLNRATHFSCLLLEVRLAEVDGKELVAVELYGDESVDEKAGSETRAGRSLMDRESFIRAKADQDLESEASAFLSALDHAQKAGATSGPQATGFYLSQTPFVPNNYLAWYVERKTADIWATGNIYEELKEHLEGAPSSVGQRIETRPIKPGGLYGKVANVSLEGASEPELRFLFEHYLKGPKPQED